MFNIILSLVSGIGYSMNFVSAVGIVPHYFEKRKAAAYAATGLGTGVGMVAFPYMLTAMLQSYGYK